MSESADNETTTFEDHQNDEQESGEGAPAAGAYQEPTIPKHRFDEVNHKARQLEEKVEMLTGILSRMQQAQTPQQVQKDLQPEDLGLDPSTFQAVEKVANQLLEKRFKPALERMGNLLVETRQKTEENEFLYNYGHDKVNILPEIRKFRENYARQYNVVMPMEHAYILVREQLAAHGRRPAQTKSQDFNQADNQNAGHGFPNGTQTRQQPRGSAPAGSGNAATKSFDDMTPEEQEALLEEQFSKGLRA